MKSTKHLITLFFSFLIFFVGCANEEKDWQKAKEQGSLESYANFNNRYINSIHKDSATREIYRLFSQYTPEISKATLNSNLSVKLSFKNVPGADKYQVFYSYDKDKSYSDLSGVIEKDKVNNSVLEIWPDLKKDTIYFKLLAITDSVKSTFSDYSYVYLLQSNNGTTCQICGNNSVGHCHLRNIYVCSQHNVFTQKSGSRIRCP